MLKRVKRCTLIVLIIATGSVIAETVSECQARVVAEEGIALDGCLRKWKQDPSFDYNGCKTDVQSTYKDLYDACSSV